MKKLYKYASGLLLTGAFSMMIVLNADAQRGGAHAGGGGSFSRGGGGSFRGGVSFGSGFGRSGFNMGYRSGYRSGFGLGLGFYGYPSLGFYLGALPFGYYPFYMGSSLYYYADGTFYRPYDDGGYIVTAPPVGAAVPKLPKGAKAIMIDNQQFYEYNGVYYKAIVNDKGENVFVVAGKDGVLNTDGDNADNATAAQAPQVGDVVNQIPDNSRRVSLNGKKYYVSPDDIYYEIITDKDGNTAYRIASVPDGN
ncbi:DUF6515 family protein [Mucilaginibacter sp.]|uniref:DUF6515 family protein n=1 Tax=Mucilaginibacter sp. TaxID=1882438 RepID=UPI002635C771|nr:DUF6515 family protein [Mucilaginibacter sp.]MDB4925572.1 hypothetical protein [Mucilaginibacter sp.]